MKYPVKESEITNFQTTQQKLQEFATSQPGCKTFKLHEDFKDSSYFWLVEEWESVDAWKPYLMSDERSANAKSLMDMMTGLPQLALYKTGSSKMAECMSNVKQGELMTWATSTDYKGMQS